MMYLGKKVRDLKRQLDGRGLGDESASRGRVVDPQSTQG